MCTIFLLRWGGLYFYLMDSERGVFKGRGAQINTANPYLANEYVAEHVEGIDAPLLQNEKTTFIRETPKKIVNRIDSPDVGLSMSMNPYQGCEHGCIYCYARNTHQYWGLSAGLDFERKIIVKENAAELLEKQLQHPKWKVEPIMLSGNTDCYQPAERKWRITRKMLEVLVKCKHPVGIITKNALILRDLDLLQQLQADNLVHVNISITTLDEKLRSKLEPRTASAMKRMAAVEKLAVAGIPVNVMMAPIIPGLNSHEIPQLAKTAAEHGASSIGYTMVRLNGAVADIFKDWIHLHFPDRAEKVLHLIEACHGGQLGDSRFGKRMRGEGQEASSIANLFKLSRSKYFADRSMPTLNTEAFCPVGGKQLNLF